jgi:hypothetical protein
MKIHCCLILVYELVFKIGRLKSGVYEIFQKIKSTFDWIIPD